MRSFFRCWFLVCALLGAAALAQAQSPSSYPDRPIRLVVAFAPGGATDTFARQITQELGEALGQSVVIENKPGAGGYIAWNYVAAAEPDGYTLLMAENAIAMSQALYQKATSSFDPVKQYDGIAAGRHVAAGARRRQQRECQLGRGAHRLFALASAETQLCLRRHRQRRASLVRGDQGGDGHAGGSRPLQGRRPRHERRDRRACRR